ncbi:flagellar protein, putative [Oceanicola granulosus HTCC2516]|uniref:Flagellar protein, putative n=1 Tax=Oceanicola granulosus (strain ATCC BAA-861 / DSM 15982 / KCTC 12143 / HTCC2516) TaxID=314256 RepID=Q2CDG9_OCEGH|nr:DUF1217 domain-containing protein [Oceanicola granulosus]EAR50742.1 flagellar protein, putative [Oceanicola granulosus HTCC2516]
MSFQPVLPLAGYAGYRFLARTLEVQQAAYAASAPIERATESFREKVPQITSIDDLLDDRQAMQVVLGAFGLDDDIDSAAFVRKVLEEGTVAPDSFAIRLSDKRYLQLADALGFGDLGGAGKTQWLGFADVIVARYEARQFERAVGEQDEQLRIALSVSRGVEEVLQGQDGRTARWFAIMGNAPLRSVFETALGFSSSFGSIDLDQQLEQFQERTESVLGSGDPADFENEAVQEKLIRLYMVRTEMAASQSLSGAAAALTLLQGL